MIRRRKDISSHGVGPSYSRIFGFQHHFSSHMQYLKKASYWIECKHIHLGIAETLEETFIYSVPGHLRVPTDKPRKISMIFQWYFKTKIPNFHDNSERYKMEKHRTMCYTWSLWPLALLGVFKKICKVFLLMNNISVNNAYVKYIFIYPCS